MLYENRLSSENQRLASMVGERERQRERETERERGRETEREGEREGEGKRNRCRLRRGRWGHVPTSFRQDSFCTHHKKKKK